MKRILYNNIFRELPITCLLIIIPQLAWCDNITFADSNVKAICITNWDTNGDGELSYEEAATVKDLGKVFYNNEFISTFEELQFFSGITSIKENAFWGCGNMTSIIIPNSTQSIGKSAFENCSKLSNIIIPNSVFTIGEDAFYLCSNLATITIPNSVTSINSYAFGFSGLTNILIPSSVRYMGKNPFYGCNSLTSIVVNEENNYFDSRDNCNSIIETSSNTLLSGCISTDIPHSVIHIGETAFACLYTLNNIIIPNSVITLGRMAFKDCYNLSSVAIPNSVTDIKEYAFWHCSNLSSVSLPYSLTTIDNNAFDGCRNLTSINIPYSVTSIGSSAFSGCLVKEVKVEWTEPLNIGNNTFSFISNATLYVPKGSKTVYTLSSNWSRFNEIIEYSTEISFKDENVKTICVANWDTNGDGELSYVEAATVTDLGQAFSGQSEITSFDELQYFTGVESINENAFNSCSLSSLTFPNSLLSIGNDAFVWCGNLKSINIPSSVTSIKENAFRGCNVLETITVDATNTVYDSRDNSNAVIETSTNTLVLGCKNTVIPNTVSAIGDCAFMDMITDTDDPTSLTIPNSVISIGSLAFHGCVGLHSITIPKSVTSIGHNAFATNWFLTSITVEDDNQVFDSRDNSNAVIETATNKLIVGCKNTVIPHSVTTIGHNAFYYCGGPTVLEIPNSVITLEGETFRSCPITSVVIPRSVTEIGERAFYSEYDDLREVKVGMIIPVPIGPDAFPHRAIATLYVPIGTKAAYEAADYWKEFKEIVEMEEPNRLEADTLKIMTGRTKSLSLSLENQDDIIMVEFELQLPEGFEIAKDEDDEFIAELNSERVAKSHTLEVADHGNGKYKFLVYSSKNAALKGNTGELLHFDITCGKDVADGTYQATVSSIILSDTQENGIYPSDFTFDIIAVNAIPGDVNGDENINGLDIVKIVGYIMGSPTQPFIEAAADLNEDEVINGLDLVKLVSLVLSQSSTQSASGAKAMRAAVRVAEKKLLLDEERHGMLRMGTAEVGKYILSQFTVVTDGSISINDITTDGSHVVAFRQTGENRYAVVCYSQTNAAFRMNSDMVKIHYTGNGSIRIQDAMMVDEDENLVRFNDVSNVGTTGIDGIVSEIKPADIYTLGGKLVKKNATTMKGLPQGTYIVNGQKINIK